MKKLNAYVCDTSPEKIQVKVINELLGGLLKSYGFKCDPILGIWFLEVEGKQQVKAYDFLRNNKICFANGPSGWPPGALFEYWREQRLLEGEYLSVSWRNKNDYYIEER